MSEWDWKLTETARRDFNALDDHARDRIASKLDEIVTDEWREPMNISNRCTVLPTKNSVSVRSGSGVGPTEPKTLSTFYGFENAVAMHIAVKTIERFPTSPYRPV